MTIRDYLRQATRELHERLDRAMPHDLSDPARYGDFLRIQLGARIPIDSWLAENAKDELIPPSQIGNIRADLKRLGCSDEVDAARFELPPASDPLGVAWVLAGSHLGNRFLLKQFPQGTALPTAFLGDQAMIGFWKRLQPRLQAELPETAVRAAILSAEAVFELFLEHVEQAHERLAA